MGNEITIVSGLPRSGTSMMMRILEAGGMIPAVDNVREADEDNPHGYFEFEDVKKIKEDTSWLTLAEGKAVKMVSMLLYDLPSERKYRVIFMKRHLDEILASQKKMLARQGKEGVSDEELRKLYSKHLNEIQKWLGDQNNIKTLYISYNDIIGDPRRTIESIDRFLGKDLDLEKMTQAVDASLYRQRASTAATSITVPEGCEAVTADGRDKEKIEAQLRALGYM